MEKIKLFLGVLFVSCIFIVGPVNASKTITENVRKSVEKRLEKFEIKGFRSATFGQTQEEVLKSIKSDFGINAKDVKISRHKKDKTTTLSITVKSLAPFSVDGFITYILGYKTKKLFKVNVYWASRAKTKKDLIPFTMSALSLSEYYSKYDLSDYNIFQGNKIKNGIILLGLIHKKSPNTLMELVLFNINISMNKKKEFDVDIIKNKNAIVKITYIADVQKIDVFTIRKGEF